MNLDGLFVSLKDEKGDWLNASKGGEFEDRILVFLLRKMGLTRLLKSDIDKADWKRIKNHVSNKLSSEFLDVPDSVQKRSVIYQPFGAQNFPDFIVFTDKKVVPVEAKFSAQAQSKPMWNSNIPLANAFYIFGSYGLKDVTFFCGDDVLARGHRESLYNFFKKDLQELQKKIRSEMPEMDLSDRGFTPYIRAAYDHRNHKDSVQTNFFIHPKRKEVEEHTIKLAAELQ